MAVSTPLGFGDTMVIVGTQSSSHVYSDTFFAWAGDLMNPGDTYTFAYSTPDRIETPGPILSVIVKMVNPTETDIFCFVPHDTETNAWKLYTGNSDEAGTYIKSGRYGNALDNYLGPLVGSLTSWIAGDQHFPTNAELDELEFTASRGFAPKYGFKSKYGFRREAGFRSEFGF